MGVFFVEFSLLGGCCVCTRADDCGGDWRRRCPSRRRDGTPSSQLPVDAIARGRLLAPRPVKTLHETDTKPTRKRTRNRTHDTAGGGRRTAFRELREEIGLTADHVDVQPDQPVWVVHAGYRHAVYVATLSEENRLCPDWNLGDEETPELDAYSCTFVDFANYFADDMVGYEMVHRRIKTREVFDLASSAYVDMCRAAHRAKVAARAADFRTATTTPTTTARCRLRLARQ